MKFNLPPCKILVKFGYSTRYGYETDERGRVMLINGGRGKANGYIAVSYKREVGKKRNFAYAGGLKSQSVFFAPYLNFTWSLDTPKFKFSRAECGVLEF